MFVLTLGLVCASPTLNAEAKHTARLHSQPGSTRNSNALLLKNHIEAQSEWLEDTRNQLLAEDSALAERALTIQRDQKEIDKARAGLDRTDPAALRMFNRTVDATNLELKSYEQARVLFNARVSAFNARIAALNSDRSKLARIASSSSP